MDYIRSCYVSYMRPFRDRPDILVKGRWHFCLPGAKDVPFPNIFSSFEWDDKEDPPYEGVGEVPLKGDYYKGKSARGLRGKHSCGTPDAWANGILYADRLKPLFETGTAVVCTCDGRLLQSGIGMAADFGVITPTRAVLDAAFGMTGNSGQFHVVRSGFGMTADFPDYGNIRPMDATFGLGGELG